MKGVRLSDLPPDVQAQILGSLDTKAKRTKDRRGAERVATNGICWACKQRFTSVTKWERHSDETGHHRFELIAEPTP